MKTNTITIILLLATLVLANNAEKVAMFAADFLTRQQIAISVIIIWDDPNKAGVNHQYIFGPTENGKLDDRSRPIVIPGGVMYVNHLPDKRVNMKDFANERNK
jgi:hypothetical protein